LGFQDAKSIEACANVTKNISKESSKFVKSRRSYTNDANKIITIAIVVPRNSRYQMVETMSKLFYASKKTLHKHTKFKVQVYENNEAAF
jgi:hypothetical protein